MLPGRVSATPATQNARRCRQLPRLPHKQPRRQRRQRTPKRTTRASEMHLCRSSSNVPRLPSFLEMPQNPHVLLTFDTVHNPLRLPRETRSERPEVVRTPSVFILTWKCASRHNGVHFLDISSAKSGPHP